MRVRFTRPALNDLDQIYAFISRTDPSAAARVVTRLVDRALELEHTPYEGREIDEPHGRVIVVPRCRYFIFYTIAGEEIHVTHIRHTSRPRLPSQGL
jgi:toxin ParE1/3/4